MGYYTRYNLTVLDNRGGSIDDALEPSFNESSLHSNSISIKELIDGDADSMKWYEHKEDMLEFSLKFPKLVFILDGEGEEGADIWREFYKNGKFFRWELPKPRPPEWGSVIKRKME